MDENDPRPHEVSEEGENEPTRICSTPRGDMMMRTMLDSDPPARRTWHVAQDLLAILATTAPPPGSSQSQILNNNNGTSSERASQLMEELVNSIEEISGLQALGNSIEALLSIRSRPLSAPPASKEVVANLPIITVTEEILVRFGSETECAVCKENLVINDKMQELPCKHLFHLLCLKPWLDKHNSCPVCRHELPTDDHAYESWKEHEKEAEEA